MSQNSQALRSRKKVNMLEGSIAKNIFIFTVPIILTGFLQNLYNTADTIVVGNFGGTSALAAVGATGSVIALLVTVVLNIFVGMNIILARQLGASDQDGARTTCRTGYVATLIFGVVIAIIGQISALPVLRLTNCPESIISGAELYLRIYFAGTPFAMFNNYAASVLRISGDSRSPFIYLTISGVVNVLFNIGFVLVFGNPVAGVAIATVLSMLVASVLFAIHMCKMDGPCHLELLRLRFDPSTFAKIVRYGLPSCISAATFSLTNLLIAPQINSYGEIGMSGNQASVSIEAYAFSITNAFQVAIVSFLGQNIGAGNKERVARILRTGYIMILSIMVVYSSLMIGFGKELLYLFIPDDPEAIAFGQFRVTLMMTGMVFNGVMNINSGAMQAYGFTIGQMISNLVGVCLFRVVWMLAIYPLAPTPFNLYVCYPVSYFLTAVVLFVIVCVLTKRYLKGKEYAL